MQSDIAKSDGIKSDLGIRSPKIAQNLTLAHRIIKSKNGIGL